MASSAGSLALADARPLALSIDGTCKALSVGRDTTYKLIRGGKLRAVKLGARTVIPLKDIERLLGLDSGTASPPVTE